MQPLFLIANWKANAPKNIDQWLDTVIHNNTHLNQTAAIVVLPPVIYIESIAKNLITKQSNTSVALGCQHFSMEDEGAFTGEIPVSLLKKSSVDYFLIGHSERRTIDVPSQETLTLLMDKTITNGGYPLYCVGETLKQYEAKLTLQTIEYQLDILNNLQQIPASIIIAYEPRWAIGTGITPSLSQIESTCKHLRKLVNNILPQTECTILYGGSLKLENCQQIFALKNVNGGLVGGASLDGVTFTKLYDSLLQSIS